MAHNIVMPALEMAQENGKLIAWRKKEGDSVTKGAPLFDIETDKAVVEIECPADGILAGVKAREGDVIPVGQTIAWIIAPGESIPADVRPSASTTQAAMKASASFASAGAAATPATQPSMKISPKARRLARDYNIDLHRVLGTGNEGEILASDIMALVDSPDIPAVPNAPVIESMSSVARLMAERTTQSWTSIPHFYLVRDIDATALVGSREKLGSAVEQGSGTRVTYTDILVGLMARVLLKHPRLNACWTNDGICLNQQINIGIATAVNDGVVMVVIPEANTKKIGEIAELRRDRADRARAGRLQPVDITGATFAISNLGMYKVDGFSAIINPPQVAILAVGQIADRVVPVDGKPGIRPMMTVTLSSDHRVVDGARAALFLDELAGAMGEPEKWLR
jgi:pyruvate dehydrogenase E2 component (dihydrolipoamide acetyltransferase)